MSVCLEWLSTEVYSFSWQLRPGVYRRPFGRSHAAPRTAACRAAKSGEPTDTLSAPSTAARPAGRAFMSPVSPQLSAMSRRSQKAGGFPGRSVHLGGLHHEQRQQVSCLGTGGGFTGHLHQAMSHFMFVGWSVCLTQVFM